jgi:hypothetical protein
MAEHGYAVEFEATALRPPAISDGGRSVSFSIGPVDAATGMFEGSVVVSVGTPAEGAPIPGGRRTVAGDTLEQLEQSFRTNAPVAVVQRAPFMLDGQPATWLTVVGYPERRTVILAAYRGRSFVITAWGFQDDGPVADPRVAGDIRAFLASIRFAGNPVYVNRTLGFQVTQPSSTAPGTNDGLPMGDGGLLVFPTGTMTAAGSEATITVAPGTIAVPAVAWTGGGDRAITLLHVWAASASEALAVLERQLGAMPIAETRLDGERASLATLPSGAIVVVAVHDQRLWLITAAGATAEVGIPKLDRFLASFRFLD